MDNLELRRELPYLRRYARAIAGSQRLGDGAVRMVLEALVEDPGLIVPGKSLKCELYRIFHDIWARGDFSAMVPTGAATLLPPHYRYALFLSAVEGFSPRDIADILASEPDAVQTDIAHARDTITRELRARVLVVEDEAIVAMHIRAILQDADHSCVGTARTHRDAVTLAKSLEPELILADISLADGSSGIDAVHEILADYDVPVIFVTAYPERLLTGERPEPTFLITKPFDPQSLLATIAQALLIHREGRDSADMAVAQPSSASL